MSLETQAPNDSADLTGSVIAVRDIEELESSVFPWQLEMRQVSRGTMAARIHIGQVGDILVTRERWSRQVTATGATPAGYLALAGTGSEKSFRWCGHEIDSNHILCGLDAAEVDFATPDAEVHWVVLMPRELVANYLGDDIVEAMGGRRVMACEPGLSRRFFALANRAVDPTTGGSGTGLGRDSVRALRADLLDAAAQLATGGRDHRRSPSARRRYQACCRAMAYARSLKRAVSVPELVAAVGVSRRTLERAFQDNLGMAPYRFLRLHRLNRLHKRLRSKRCQEETVTELLLEYGFSELGRTAWEYKKLFGESPSATLAGSIDTPGLRLADALVDARR